MPSKLKATEESGRKGEGWRKRGRKKSWGVRQTEKNKKRDGVEKERIGEDRDEDMKGIGWERMSMMSGMGSRKVDESKIWAI